MIITVSPNRSCGVSICR